MNDLKSLVETLAELKAKESELKARRTEIENQIADIIAADKKEGSKTAKVGDYKVTVTKALSYTADWDALAEIDKMLPDGIKLTKLKPEFNLKNFRVIEKTAKPEFIEKIKNILIIKPRKASVSVKPVE